MIVEICIQSLEGALLAQKYGADRLELCMALEAGGLTPSMGLYTQIKRQVTIPVHVLIRPRIGGFNYTPDEINTMLKDIELFTQSEADGIVIGALNPDYTLDTQTIKRLIAAGHDHNPKLHITAHRAFDLVPDPTASAQMLIDLGCHTLLSSGQRQTAEEGLELLQDLNARFGTELTIMPGSGINDQNRPLFAKAGFKAIHASASTLISEGTPANSVSFEEQRQVGQRREIDIDRLKNLLSPS
jgi:copper homeostasis protein